MHKQWTLTLREDPGSFDLKVVGPADRVLLEGSGSSSSAKKALIEAALVEIALSTRKP